jgi:hypothetical protein
MATIKKKISLRKKIFTLISGTYKWSKFTVLPEKNTVEMSRKLLGYLENRSGVYFVAPQAAWDGIGKDPTESFLVKIGLAENMEHRLNSYLLYWPEGFYIFGMVSTRDTQSARRTERAIHAYLNQKGAYYVSEHSHDEEWFELTLKQISKLMEIMKLGKKVRYPKDYWHKDMRGKQVFLYNEIIIETEYPILLKANRQIGRARVKPIGKSLKVLLDERQAKVGILSPISTRDHIPKKTKKRT